MATSHGVEHTYDNGASPRALMVESTGGGGGWIDYDRNGLLDLYLTQGGDPCPAEPDRQPVDAAFRHMPGGHFVESAADWRIRETSYGHGVAVGDFDHDGFDDLFVANVGRNRLFRNLGDGTFEDATSLLAGGRDVWSSSAAWGDLDQDGDLDLYVCNYAIYDPCHPIPCLDTDGIPSICHPRNVEPEPDEVFINTGDGRFVESSQRLGLFGPGNKGLGVVIADLTGDDRPDIYVANDTTANFLFVNQGADKPFVESALSLGGAFSATGEPQASMGIGFGDYDNNGFPDLVLSHFTGEHNTLYRNLGPQGLQDVSALTGLRQPALAKLGFGIILNDFNRDGYMDLFVTNGHIDPRYSDGEGYEMTPQLFSFDGARWRERPAEPGDFFTRKAVGRAVATADFDRDGDVDLCVVHHNSPAALLRNDSPPKPSLRVELIGRASNRNGFNAKVRVETSAGSRVQELAGGTSYAASHEHALVFPLPDGESPVRVEVRWPSGVVDRIERAASTNRLLVVEGLGAREL